LRKNSRDRKVKGGGHPPVAKSGKKGRKNGSVVIGRGTRKGAITRFSKTSDTNESGYNLSKREPTQKRESKRIGIFWARKKET